MADAGDRIEAFLGAFRRRLIVRAAVRSFAVALAGVVVVLLGLAVVAASLGPAGYWLPLTRGVAAAGIVAAAVVGLWRPWRTVRRDDAAARALGRLNPTLAPLSDDLVSAIELGPRRAAAVRGARPEHTPGGPFVSAALVGAFRDRLMQSVAGLDPAGLISMRPARLGALLALASAAALFATAHLFPTVVGKGLGTLLHRPSRFEGASVSAIPIVGDLRITYEYPAYTGLPARTVEGSTGDVIAVKGTRVTIETTPLRMSRGALLLLGESGDAGEIPVQLHKGRMTAHLELNESGTYRFWLQPMIGRAVRELHSHRLQSEPDRPPRVEIHGPADRLELPSPRPIEIGFAADDDFGLDRVELVFRVDDGPEHHQPLKDPHGARIAEGRTLWDPSELPLGPGARIAYHVEARDRDDVSKPKVGASRTLYVVIARPQEKAEVHVERQREILEHFIHDLGDRLELTARGSGAASRGSKSSTRNGATVPATGDEDLGRTAATTWAMITENEETHLTAIGRLIDDDRREGTLGKTLRAALAGIADRLGRLVREEKELVRKRGAVSAPVFKHNERHVAELEKDVLLMDDLIGRERLDELAAIGKELTDAHRRLQDLLTRYTATNDESLRRQLEHEIRNLRSRIAELAQKIAEIKSRNDVGEEWQNMPDTRQLAERARKLDDLLAQGDPKALGKALEDLGKDLKALRQQLDENAESFGADRFPQENRVVADLMKKIGEIEGDERSLAGETKALSEQQEAQADKRLRGKLGDFVRAESEKIERLRGKLGDVRTGNPESAFAEEVERARESARQMKRLLGERDLAETKDEADRAVASLDKLAGILEEEESGGRKLSDAREKARASAARNVAEARALAQEVSNDLRNLMPRPDETLSPEERQRASSQGDRQSAIGDRTDETAREAARKLGKMPGLDRAADDLKGAAQQMRDAAQQLRRGDAKRASGAEMNAAERLAKLRDSLQERSSGGASRQRDPVRIPGPDESNAPRAWRQELMDAMKEKPPEHFRDDVRRYYEELVR